MSSEPQPVRRLHFLVHPQGVDSGKKLFPAPSVTVLDANGNRDTTYRGDITIEIDKSFVGEYEGNRQAMRIRATAPGCEPAVSKIFYVTVPNMITQEVATELLQGKRPSFILVDEGRPQSITNEFGRGLIVATSREAAEVVAAGVSKQKGRQLSVVQTSSAECQETLTKLIELSVLQDKSTGIHATQNGEDFNFLKAAVTPNKKQE